MIEDPAFLKWNQQYPKFPGVAECVRVLSKRNTKGSLVDIICEELQFHAREHVGELLTAFETANDPRIRRMLLGIISEAKLTEASALFGQYVQSEDESLRIWSIRGLEHLDTAEAREILRAYKMQ
jgi:hypothetical protein